MGNAIGLEYIKLTRFASSFTINHGFNADMSSDIYDCVSLLDEASKSSQILGFPCSSLLDHLRDIRISDIDYHVEAVDSFHHYLSRRDDHRRTEVPLKTFESASDICPSNQVGL